MKSLSICLALTASACGSVVSKADAPGTTIAVTMAGVATGRVTSEPAGIDCPTNCSASFPTGTSVVLTATPDADAAFAGYAESCSGLAKVCTITADTDKAVTASFARSGDKRFAKQIDDAYITAIAADASGNLLIAGSSLTVTGTYLSLRSGADGSVIWETTIPTTQPELTFAPTGEIVMSGWFTGTPTWGGRVLRNGGATDFLVAKLSPADGSVIWISEFGGDRQDSAHSVSVAANGTIYVGGYLFSTSFMMGTTTLMNSATAVPVPSDAFVASLTPDGNVTWAKQYGIASGGENITGVHADAQGDVLAVGSFAGGVSWGSSFFYTAADTDGVALRLRASDGATQWGRQFGTTGTDICYAVDLGADGGMVVSGVYTGTQSFGGMMFMGKGATDAFVARYSSGGAHMWSLGAGTSAAEWATQVSIDSQGAAVVVGYFEDVDTNLGGMVLPNAGGRDVFAAKIGAGGTHIWSYRYGGGLDDFGQAVAIDPFDTIFAAGTFRGTADVAGETFTTTASSASFLVSYWP